MSLRWSLHNRYWFYPILKREGFIFILLYKSHATGETADKTFLTCMWSLGAVLGKDVNLSRPRKRLSIICTDSHSSHLVTGTLYEIIMWTECEDVPLLFQNAARFGINKWPVQAWLFFIFIFFGSTTYRLMHTCANDVAVDTAKGHSPVRQIISLAHLELNSPLTFSFNRGTCWRKTLMRRKISFCE